MTEKQNRSFTENEIKQILRQSKEKHGSNTKLRQNGLHKIMIQEMGEPDIPEIDGNSEEAGGFGVGNMSKNEVDLFIHDDQPKSERPPTQAVAEVVTDWFSTMQLTIPQKDAPGIPVTDARRGRGIVTIREDTPGYRLRSIKSLPSHIDPATLNHVSVEEALKRYFNEDGTETPLHVEHLTDSANIGAETKKWTSKPRSKKGGWQSEQEREKTAKSYQRNQSEHQK